MNELGATVPYILKKMQFRVHENLRILTDLSYFRRHSMRNFNFKIFFWHWYGHFSFLWYSFKQHQKWRSIVYIHVKMMTLNLHKNLTCFIFWRTCWLVVSRESLRQVKWWHLTVVYCLNENGYQDFYDWHQG